MPGLSIVIAALGDVASLEATLVSVLSHQPHDSEVIVVLRQPYDDPYQLADEVRFVTARRGANWAQCANAGLQASRAPIVHLLHAGVEATEGWTDAAVAHFDDPRVASVTPLLLDAQKPDRVLSAGVSYRMGGVRRDVGESLGRVQHPSATRTVLGPGRLAGFYRKSILAEITGDFATALGASAADVDLALRLRQAGGTNVVETGSRLMVSPALLQPPGGEFRRALEAERLFWRNVPLHGWGKSLAAHAATLLLSLVASAVRPWRLPLHLSGRLLGCFGMGSVNRHHLHLAAMRELTSPATLQLESVSSQRSWEQARPLATPSIRDTVPLRRSA